MRRLIGWREGAFKYVHAADEPVVSTTVGVDPFALTGEPTDFEREELAS